MEIIEFSQDSLTKAIQVINDGGVVICPTDTVYGFLADATNKKAVDKIYKIKKRPKSKPLPMFVSSIKMAREIAEIDAKQLKYIKKYWPGAYTFVLKRKSGLKLYGVDKKTVALRIPKHAFLQKLLKKVDRPVAQTSVNVSNQPPASKIHDIINQFDEDKSIGLIIDGGNLLKPNPSKIMDVTGNTIKTIRN